jgi:hypothetical protein
MKTLNRVLIAAAVAAVLGVSSSVRAQSQMVGNDGIAASPKLRAQMNERARVSGVVDKDLRVVPLSTAASPKVVVEREALTKAAGAAGVASKKATASDGIAASPRLRQQMNERPQAVEIAPVK